MPHRKTFVSVIIPVRTETAYLKETISYLKKQAYNYFELIVVTDAREKIAGARVVPSGLPGPAYKRNLGAKKARGEILAFLDDDSYPSRDWLKNAIKIFHSDLLAPSSELIAAVCGPCLTPPQDDIYQKASGWVWGSWLGSSGAGTSGTYRNRASSRREVDDFPTVNLLVRKKDFLRVGGFDTRHWPGEDTKLCLDLTRKLKKKIIYDPGVVVYHHRRPILGPHLKQISRYARRRGFFAKKFPETSMRPGYLAPSLFVFGLVFGGLLALVSPGVRQVYLLVLGVYLFLLAVSGIEVLVKERNVWLAFLVMAAIFLTHLWYGILFPFGYWQKDLGVIPHKVDKKKREYIGG